MSVILSVSCAECQLFRASFRLCVSYAECQLCWVSVMLSVSYTKCDLCWVSVMLSVSYAECQLYLVSVVLSVSYAQCQLYWVSVMLSVSYAECQLCWVSHSSPICWLSISWISLCWVSWYLLKYIHSVPVTDRQTVAVPFTLTPVDPKIKWTKFLKQRQRDILPKTPSIFNFHKMFFFVSNALSTYLSMLEL